LPELRRALAPTRFVITTLPSWLEQREFARLAQEVDGYVLQVHSVPLAEAGGGRLCDPQRARRWVRQAARLRHPFSVALPTYRCTAGYDLTGRLIGVAMDGVQPVWPPETRILTYSPDADALAGWQVDSHPTRALFTVASGHHLRLPPGASRRIGWLRQRGDTAPTLTCHDETSFSR
jgi:hypothetical protein